MRNVFIVLGALLLFFSIARAGGHPTHTVQPGDTLWDIAISHDTSWQELASLNKIKDPAKVQVGTKLRLPSDANSQVRSKGDMIVELSEKEKDLLIRVVAAESRGESLEGQTAVAAVILNRVQTNSFPNTVWDVLHEKGQFTPVQSNSLPRSAGPTSVEAVERALYGEDPTGGALYFYNPVNTQAADFWATKTVIKRIGNHNFAL